MPPPPISQTVSPEPSQLKARAVRKTRRPGQEHQEAEDDQRQRVGEQVVQVGVQQREREDVQEPVQAARPQAERAVQGMERQRVDQLDDEQQHDEARPPPAARLWRAPRWSPGSRGRPSPSESSMRGS